MENYPTTTTTTKAPAGARSRGDNVDMTSIVRGKKINPKTGTQTSEDDPNGVWEGRVHNEIQMEHAGHTQTQTVEGAGEVLADTLNKVAGNDGNKTPVEPKPINASQVQNDAKDVSTNAQEEVQADNKIQQGETGPENRTDLTDLRGGASGSNAGPTINP
jgi:hypothetical protein